jgi:trans-aconitate methyltransferase
MGGGRALAMRQIANTMMNSNIDMTNVDLFNWGIEDITDEEHAILEKESPGMTDRKNAPTYVEADVQTVTLSGPADLITSLEVIQYLNNPLSAIANWYNQLEDRGIMAVATEWDWASWLRTEDDIARKQKTPTEQLLLSLGEAGIQFAITSDVDRSYRKYEPNRFRVLAVEKAANTKMTVNVPVTEIWINPDKYKAVYYAKPEDPLMPMVEVVCS